MHFARSIYEDKMSSWPPEFITDGKCVRLEISRKEHAEDLASVVAKSQLNKLWYTMIPLPRCRRCDAELD